jgi:tetratricopeptide (TPR) repeat protein
LIDENKERRVLMGDSYMERENFYLALKEYTLASGYDPDDTLIQAKAVTAEERLSSTVRPLIQEGAALEKEDDFAEAVSAYDSALKMNPESREALRGKTRAATALNERFRKLFNKGRKQLTAADYPGAMNNFRRAERLKPDDTGLKKEMAKAMAGLGEYIERKMEVAESAMQKGDYPTAIAAYTEVNDLDAGNREAKEGLKTAGGLLSEIVGEKLALADDAFSRSRYQGAFDLYGEILALDKRSRRARDGRARALRKLDSIASLNKKGVAKYKKRDDKGAAYDFKKVLEIDPGNRTAKKYLANISGRKGPRLGKKAIERLYLEGIELYTDGKYVGAIKKWEKVLKADPRHDKALFNIRKAKRKLEGVMDVK